MESTNRWWAVSLSSSGQYQAVAVYTGYIFVSNNYGQGKMILYNNQANTNQYSDNIATPTPSLMKISNSPIVNPSAIPSTVLSVFPSNVRSISPSSNYPSSSSSYFPTVFPSSALSMIPSLISSSNKPSDSNYSQESNNKSNTSNTLSNSKSIFIIIIVSSILLLCILAYYLYKRFYNRKSEDLKSPLFLGREVI